jgi:hypothetical protein
MLRFWRKWRSGGGFAVPAVPRVDQLSPHLLKDLNLPSEPGFLAPESIRFRKLPLITSF